MKLSFVTPHASVDNALAFFSGVVNLFRCFRQGSAVRGGPIDSPEYGGVLVLWRMGSVLERRFVAYMQEMEV